MAKTDGRMRWRLLFLVVAPFLFIPGAFCLVWQIVAAGIACLVMGPDPERTDRITLGGPSGWIFKPMDWLAEKGGLL